MKRHPHTVPPFIIYLFLVIGLISAVAFRMLTILNSTHPALVRPVWYLGVIGYILFFAYRYYISEKRKKTILDNNLIKKISGEACLSENDRELLHYLMSSIVKSKENVNYLFIFVLSLIAIALDFFISHYR
jgi:hypothetical protein